MSVFGAAFCLALLAAPPRPTALAKAPVAFLPEAATRPTTASRELNRTALLLSTSDWNQIATDTVRTRGERPLRFEAPYGDGTVTVEQRRYEIHHASPMELTKAFRSVMTRGLGRMYFDPKTAELVVVDRPEMHERLWRYFQAMDTPKPARLLTIPPSGMAQALELLRQRLSPTGEAIPFEDEGVIVIRGEEKRLGGAEAAVRSALAREAEAQGFDREGLKGTPIIQATPGLPETPAAAPAPTPQPRAGP